MADDELPLRTHEPADERIAPPKSFVEQANVSDNGIYAEFEEHWPDEWERAGSLLDWYRNYDSVFDESEKRWFSGGQLNASYNCVDRHAEDRKNQLAIRWEGWLGETRKYTYQDLYHEVNEVAAVLRSLGVEAGDVVTLHMPGIPELPIAMLACARIGAPHAVVFAGYSADALAMRMDESNSEYLITCDGYYRRGDAVALKNKADTACARIDQDVTTIVVDRLGDAYDVSLGENSHDYETLRQDHAGETVDPVARDANDELFLIYTSGTTGMPKRVTHTTGGYLSHVAWTSHAVLDLEPEDTHLCTADIGWITGHSYVVYGPLALGSTVLLYEGESDYPSKSKFWELIERHAVDVFYTSPNTVRKFMKWGTEYPAEHDLSSLRLLGTVGEPISPRAWKWYYEHVGNGECPIVDTWWQTETGGHMISTLPGVDDMKPGAAGPPLPGISATIVDSEGRPVDTSQGGYLVIDRPWPGMPQELAEGVRWAETGDTDILSGFDWGYSTEDGALLSDSGHITILGRLDDVIKVSGYRFGTMELESAIASVDGVAETAVVDGIHDNPERGLYAYVSPGDNYDPGNELRKRIESAIEEQLGTFAVPDRIVFTPALPKTQSGKIMRRLLEDVANDEDLGDTSSLRNPEVVGEIQSAVQD